MKIQLAIISLFLTTQARANWIESPNRFIVKTKSPESLINEIASNKSILNLSVQRWAQSSRDHEFMSIEFPVMTSQKANEEALKKLDNIEWIAPVRYFEGDPRENIVNDPSFVDQHHHKIISSNEAWKISTGVEEVIIAVTDDGFDLNHEDLKDMIAVNTAEIPNNKIDDDNNGFIDDVNGWDFAEGDNSPMSDRSNGAHGTHVAGITSATWDNGIGVTGMGPMVKVLPIKFYGGGKWTNEIVLKSYQYAVLRGAKIVNTSYNVDGLATDPVYLSAIDEVYKSGGVVFNSAGNSNAHQSARTKVENMILVASTQSGSNASKHDLKSSFSNYGHGVDIAAPGNPIYSLGRGNKYMDMSGTSMASPVAAGAMAYLWSVFPEKSREEVFALLAMGSDDIDSINSKYTGKLGSGRVNLLNAVTEKARPLTIKTLEFDAKTRELIIHFNGVLSQSTRSVPSIMVQQKGKAPMNLRPLNKVFLGTNTLRYSAPQMTGEVSVLVDATTWIDALGRPLDGDRDGQAGGNWSFDLKI